MKESLNELYTKLYNENFQELEEKRKNESKKSLILIFGILGFFIAIVISGTMGPVISSVFIILFVIFIITVAIIISKMIKKPKNGELSYRELFKEKIIKPLIENEFEGATYSPRIGISRQEYNKGLYKESYDRFYSDDLVTAPLKVNEKQVTNIIFSEVHTERETEDSDGNTSYVTVFHGLAGRYNLSKGIKFSLFIRSNGKVGNWNKSKVNMDMSEFEKLFDVECEDKILAMRILTSDVMTEMIDLYNKYKYRFEISIINNEVNMRLSSGAMFEPKVFGNSMEYKMIEKYYLVLKAITNIASHIYEIIDNIEI